jgi:hypothetical protein
MRHPAYRNMWISLGVGLLVLAIGMVLLRHADEARAAFVMVCLILTVALRHVLDHRADRKRVGDRQVNPRVQN